MLRSLDALHIQCALSVGGDCVITYDTRMIDACSQVGSVTVQPGANTGEGATGHLQAKSQSSSVMG